MDSRIILFTSIWCSYHEMRNTSINIKFCEDIRKLYHKWYDENNTINGFDETKFSMLDFIDKQFIHIEDENND